MDHFMSQSSLAFFTFLCFLFTSLISAEAQFIKQAAANEAPANISLNPVQKNSQDEQAKYVFDVVIHEPEEMEKLLTRIEQLSSTIKFEKDDPSLALVLHGPEIAFFTKKNYSQYMNLVDRAAALDKKGIIDVKVCDTMIRALDIEKSELPDFVEHVPFGPAEVRRLVSQGFIKM
jgi:intracellular sulfur oxidation DsrE/DsrF family protein